jgi:hypothetical protein
MTRYWLMLILLPAAAGGQPQKPNDTPGSPPQVEAAHHLLAAAAQEYEIRVGRDGKPLHLVKEPVLKWSNPAASDIQGNVFIWTRDGRPLIVGSFFKWFKPPARMDHEFQSLAEVGVSAAFHGKPAWKTGETGVTFAEVPGAPAPAASDAQRLLQLKKLVKEFTATGKYQQDMTDTELRLLPRPLYTYTAPKEGVLAGGLFAFVRGTDPELVLLIEARGKDAAAARWRYAAARLTNIAALRLAHGRKEVWATELLPWTDVFQRHEGAYTIFGFKKTPDFLKSAGAAKP